MLSYRHAFHAGNHADVLKHFVLCTVLDYMSQKDKPYWVVDTHAGAGLYALGADFAQKNAEFNSGIARLIQANNLHPALARYVALVQSFNAEQSLAFYPGSPKLAEALLRENDKLCLFELHPSDNPILQENFRGKGKQTRIMMQDGFAGLKACLPPPTKRAVVLIDPPYELKTDYEQVVASIKDSLYRFATGTYLIWYPLLQRPEPAQMVAELKALPIQWLDVSLRVQTPSAEGFGMFGSGMLVINPPWVLPEILESTMPQLAALLTLGDAASYMLTKQLA